MTWSGAGISLIGRCDKTGGHNGRPFAVVNIIFIKLLKKIILNYVNIEKREVWRLKEKMYGEIKKTNNSSLRNSKSSSKGAVKVNQAPRTPLVLQRVPKQILGRTAEVEEYERRKHSNRSLGGITRDQWTPGGNQRWLETGIMVGPDRTELFNSETGGTRGGALFKIISNLPPIVIDRLIHRRRLVYGRYLIEALTDIHGAEENIVRSGGSVGKTHHIFPSSLIQELDYLVQCGYVFQMVEKSGGGRVLMAAHDQAAMDAYVTGKPGRHAQRVQEFHPLEGIHEEEEEEEEEDFPPGFMNFRIH